MGNEVRNLESTVTRGALSGFRETVADAGKVVGGGLRLCVGVCTPGVRMLRLCGGGHHHRQGFPGNGGLHPAARSEDDLEAEEGEEESSHERMKEYGTHGRNAAAPHPHPPPPVWHPAGTAGRSAMEGVACAAERFPGKGVLRTSVSAAKATDAQNIFSGFCIG